MPTKTPELVDALRRVPLLSEVSGRTSSGSRAA